VPLREFYEENKPPVRLTSPPDELEVRFTIQDRMKDYRGCICEDGTCFDDWGKVKGHLNFETMEAGSAEETFLGSCFAPKFDNQVQVRDATDTMGRYFCEAVFIVASIHLEGIFTSSKSCAL
jgi:hypothetical protein